MDHRGLCSDQRGQECETKRTKLCDEVTLRHCIAIGGEVGETEFDVHNVQKSKAILATSFTAIGVWNR
jgi:hypothetical protein